MPILTLLLHPVSHHPTPPHCLFSPYSPTLSLITLLLHTAYPHPTPPPNLSYFISSPFSSTLPYHHACLFSPYLPLPSPCMPPFTLLPHPASPTLSLFLHHASYRPTFPPPPTVTLLLFPLSPFTL
ncbi:hypothetical protein Pcinc_024097 [Petrolisthes cinctipes]|uniref:Uncharacterized protein n=1 Tax=Petrolisthes cinctipes TaxID=88211 RepID=A0AAE1FDI5_PETCI|nr:hypothetical protein Pcinc_024097 [Petrolisthes cinctipes]